MIFKIFGKKSILKDKQERLKKLKILLTALYNNKIFEIPKTLFIKLVFLIDHYLDKKLSPKPRVFGYNFYVYKHGVFTAKLLADLERLGISYKREGKRVFVEIKKPFVEVEKLTKEERELYEKFKKMIKEYVEPYLYSPDELSNFILENLLGISPGQKAFYYYVSVEYLIEKNLSKISQQSL